MTPSAAATWTLYASCSTRHRLARPRPHPTAGDHQGVDTVLGYFAKTAELTGGNFRVEIHDIVANDEHAVGLHTAYAEREGETLQDNNALVFHVRDGKVTQVRQYWADSYTADELFA